MTPELKPAGGPDSHPARRAADRRRCERRGWVRRRTSPPVVSFKWDEQRTQFITRYLFAALGLAYFNFGEVVARDPDYLLTINVVHLVYIALTTVFMLHAWYRVASSVRLRLAMWTDVVAVSIVAFADTNLLSPAYLVYVAVILGNGMRYGLRAFAESGVSSLVAVAVVLALRREEFLESLSTGGLFFILFIGIIILYAYALLANLERARRNLEIESCNDALTGLLNRRGLKERAAALFNMLATEPRAVAVLFADLDGFKAVNDAYGHDAGDRLLREIGQAIAAQVRAGDIVARFGGDEFVVILPDANLEHAARVARRLQKVVTGVGGGRARLSLTIGMGLAPEHGSDLEAVLKAVDVAMYQGKLAGRGGGIRRTDGGVVA